MNSEKPVVSYGALARLFLKMSVQAFGGPIAHIAMGEDEIVNRRKWLTHEEYMDMVAATNLIPGPNSTEVMIHVGHKTRGIPGAVLAGVCFITPSFLITLVLAILYVQYGNVPQVESALWGIQPIIVAIIAAVAYRLAPTVIKSRELVVLFVVSLILMAFSEIDEVIVMLAMGFIFAAWKNMGSKNSLIALIAPIAFQTAATTQAVPLSDVFWYFLRIGATLFGSGYVLISYIQNDLVNTLGWLTNQQLLDAIAIGQVSPGPVSTTATVVGYIVGGIPAAIVATVAVFLPAFVLVILTAPLIPRMRRSAFWSAFLSGINAAVLAAIIITTLRLAITAFHPLATDPLSIGSFSLIAISMFLLSLFAMIRLRVNTTILIAIGALLGILLGLLLS